MTGDPVQVGALPTVEQGTLVELRPGEWSVQIERGIIGQTTWPLRIVMRHPTAIRPGWVWVYCHDLVCDCAERGLWFCRRPAIRTQVLVDLAGGRR